MLRAGKVGIGGIYPISFSLISDYFREEHRASASAWLGPAWAIGMPVGPGLAGYMIDTHGRRIAFIPALIIVNLKIYNPEGMSLYLV